jgi:lipopolysaccharide export system permease protein
LKVLTRYILGEFFKPFLLSLAGFSVIVLVVQIFNDMHLLMEFRPTLWVTLKYFSTYLPEFLVQIIPISCLFGVLFSLGGLSRGNELIAMRSGGVNIYLIAVPLFFTGLGICFTTLCFSELLVPKAEALKRHTKSVEITKHPEESANLQRQNISMVGTEGQIYHIGSFDGTNNTMSDILMLEFDANTRLKARLDARAAKYENGEWVFFSGYQRVFDDTGAEISDQPFERLSIPIPEKPADFLKAQKEPEELNLLELAAYIRQLKRNGSDYHKELVTFYLKFASPFGCVIMAVLGVPWGWSMRKYTGIIANVGFCLLIAFAYIGGMQIGQHLGESGLVPPFISVWIGNVVFAIVGPILLVWKNR